MPKNSYSLLELNEFIKRTLSLNLQQSIWVRCEIAQANTTRGHVYIQLVEKIGDEIVAKSQAIIWSSTYQKLATKLKGNIDKLLQDGMEVLVQVKVDFHEVFGLKLIINDIDPSFSLGQLEIKKQEVIAKLNQLKLMDLNAQLPLPIVVQRIAVLSSERAAGWKDFLTHLNGNPYGYQFGIQLFSTSVQGQFVEAEMQEQFARIEDRKDEFDAVIIIRGGGSKLDLIAFDSFELSKRIAEFPLPVLTGIGHEIDLSIADMVAHRAFKTPTAVAGFLIELMIEFESGLNSLKQRLDLASANIMSREKMKLSNLSKDVRNFLIRKVASEYQTLENFKSRLPGLIKQVLKNEQKDLSNIKKLIEQLNPQNILKKGYSITSVNGKVLKSINDVKEGQSITTKLKEGSIVSTVNNITK